MLPVDYEGDDYRFHKTLHQDILLVQDEWHSKWDMQFENGDVVNVTGGESLRNAVCIAIMTRFKELDHNSLYAGFGCRIHEVIKANMSSIVRKKIEYFTEDVLQNMRRIKSINDISVTELDHGYNVYFNITSISDKVVSGEVEI